MELYYIVKIYTKDYDQTKKQSTALIHFNTNIRFHNMGVLQLL